MEAEVPSLPAEAGVRWERSQTGRVALVAVADAFPAEALSDVTAVAARLAEHPAIATINLYRADIEELLSQSATVLQTLVEMRA